MHQHRDFDSTLELFSLKVINPNQVKNVVVDMWDPYHKAIRRALPMCFTKTKWILTDLFPVYGIHRSTIGRGASTLGMCSVIQRLAFQGAFMIDNS
ncbi:MULTISPECIES: transposase [Bacillaceae]|jgi:hypothetical protein|uniref:transposase n=1 Tax=Anoxybacillaceae TaxID=3120669 RepID=UPI001F073D59|nr:MULTISPECIES: transposase [Bacillaceae]MED3665654.1 transposase [Geobacillus stearothermophilus]WMT18664.1 hypothetical protein RFB12_15655 [Parageobacillus toebii]GLH62510.1 hypothetical protein PG301_03500 [Parageobacillus sp. G301]